jgi:hypothetical protein
MQSATEVNDGWLVFRYFYYARIEVLSLIVMDGIDALGTCYYNGILGLQQDQ